ncbi:hypothetical protein Pedsa_1845 [Pseudopedobacter saltans DSM 12145]|uniref:WD40-like beta Propeller containing protein n=1 Tax=Pseudopedobacter saltans (strain ATCC 51119 / DSM 12145 / JCM 21818 / CCUG 39354 / LMG 10337 / NBRC 100064 / NCIMB 13643) TaxID=762903 RepID=F0S8R9_PSESL|nr:PD40 domain-containing protein [Pseudopedobacter saltans]ADY52400.1 hypothetical protein Pedsa_1845 [Pseudopedobacter saltans DSM 12145]
MHLYKIIISLKISYLLLIISTTTSHNVFAQFFNGSQNHPSVKFKQITQPGYQIIFPQDATEQAQKVANVLEHAIKDVSKSLGHSPRPISIILQIQTTEANGFVQMAPRRMELYTIPSQEFDFQDWLSSLVIHELRHVVQYDKLVPNLGAPLFEELKLALFGVNLPAWFFEGDATITETLLTEAGRGRQPIFDQSLRTNLLSNRKYSYSKNYLGSLKNITPNYYTLGYYMTAKLRYDYGKDILNSTLSRIGKFPLRPYNFSRSLKRNGAYTTTQLYTQTMQYLDSVWTVEKHKRIPQKYNPLNPVSLRQPSNYLLPLEISKDSILFLKTSLSEPNHIGILHDNIEQKITSIGPQLENNFSYANGKITWDEYRQDERYGKRTYNEINIYNLHTKKHSTLTKRSKSFSPALSKDGKNIAFVSVDDSGDFNLKEISLDQKITERAFPKFEGYILQTPSYSKDGKKVVVTGVNEKGKTILIYDKDKQLWTKLFEEERQLISRPIFALNGILYKAHYTGVENIFYFDLEKKKKYQISNSEFGATNASLVNSEDEILFNDYQADGYNIVKAILKPYKEISAPDTTQYNPIFLDRLKTQENTQNVFENIQYKTYPIKKYSELAHLFYFHSLTPIAENLDNDARIGFNLVSDNKLNTLSSSIGYAYNSSIGSNEFFSKISYKKYYPIFSVDYTNEENLSYARLPVQGGYKPVPFTWRESRTNFEVYVPFFKNWLNKGFSTGLRIGTSYIQKSDPSIRLIGYKKTLLFPMQYQLSLSYSTTKAARDLAPKFGISILANYQNYPFDNKVNGEFIYLKSAIFLPGMYTNHSFQLRYSQQHSSGTFVYNTSIPRARGYSHFSPIAKLENTMLLDYKLPIAYPDWELGPIAYIKRLRGGLFSDFENFNADKAFKSYGLSFGADMNLLRYYLPNFALDTRFIIPAQKNTSKNAIFEIGLTFNY